jgi:hypothetical protein
MKLLVWLAFAAIGWAIIGLVALVVVELVKAAL